MSMNPTRRRCACAVTSRRDGWTSSMNSPITMYAPSARPSSRNPKLVLMYRRTSGVTYSALASVVTLLGLALGQSAEPIDVAKHEPPALVRQKSFLDPAAEHTDGGLDRRAGHVGQTLSGEVER